MNMKTKNLTKRIVTLAAVVLLIMATLVGCGSSKAKTLTVGNINATQGVNNLSAEEISKIATMLSSVYSVDYDTQEMIIAASRGYDMTVEGFDDSKVDPKVNNGLNMDAVKNVITKSNDKASAANKIDITYLDRINEADVNTLIGAFKVTADTASNGGFWDPILTGIGAVLRWITNTLCFGSYFVGICLFAVIIEILMLPFAIKQQRNSIRQAKLRPKEMAIRNKYKGRNDQVTMQKMQQEIQEFYQRENFSPYSGCLPLLIQLPIIMALYNIIIDPLHYVLGQGAGISQALATFATTARAAGGAGLTLGNSNGTIESLSEIKRGAIDLGGLADFAFFTNGSEVLNSLNAIVSKIPNFTIGGINFGLNPSTANWVLLLVPVLTFVTYFFTSKINRKIAYQPAVNEGADARQVACSNTMMDVTMPAMSTFFTFMVPALVGVYWIFRSLVSLAKQFIISKVMPLPKFTEEDYKAAEREMKGKKVVKKSNNVGKVRSLHHIDDEDFDDTRERALARKAAIEEREREEQQQKADKTPFAAMPLKEDRKKDRKATETDKNEENPENDNQNNIQE
jgi:YidC/Oxa1 family membrane protein insertase